MRSLRKSTESFYIYLSKLFVLISDKKKQQPNTSSMTKQIQ